MSENVVAVGGLPLSLPAEVITEAGWREIQERYDAMQAALAPVAGRWRAPAAGAKHYGPGPHPGTGTPQSVHAGRQTAGLAFLQHNPAVAPKISEMRIDAPHVEDYWQALALDDPEAVAMLQRAGKTAKEARRLIAEARQIADNTPQTRDLYFKDGAYTPERQRLHEEIEKELLRGPEGQAEPSLFLTGGLPGAGKSSTMKQPQYAGYKERHTVIDSDAIKERLARADGITKLGALAYSYHAEADDIIAAVFEQAARRRMNIGLDGTLKNDKKMLALVDKFTALGYRVEVMYVDLPVKKAMLRAIGRFLEGGRFVDPIYIATHDRRNIKTLEALKSKVHLWRHWDVDVPFGQPPRLVAEGGRA